MNISLPWRSLASAPRGRVALAMRQTVCASLLLATASIANAKWTDSGNVLQVFSHDGLYFVQTTIVDNPCGSAGKFWWPATDSDAKDMYAMALTALATDKPLAVVYDETAPNCIYSGQLTTIMVINH